MKRYMINPGKVANKEVGNLFIPELGITLTPGGQYDLVAQYGKDAVDAAVSLSNAIRMGWVDLVDPPAPPKATPKPKPVEPEPTPEPEADAEEDEVEDEAEEDQEADPNAVLFDTAVTLEIVSEAESGRLTLPKPNGKGNWRFDDRDHALARMKKSPEIVQAIKDYMEE